MFPHRLIHSNSFVYTCQRKVDKRWDNEKVDSPSMWFYLVCNFPRFTVHVVNFIGAVVFTKCNFTELILIKYLWLLINNNVFSAN